MRRRHTRARLLALAPALALALVLPGCLSLTAAHVPDAYLTNGWSKDGADSQSQPVAHGSFEKTQTLAYQASSPSQGYPAFLSVTTLRALVRPSEDKIRPLVQDYARAAETAKGIQVAAGSEEGTRRIANGADGFWFVVNGTASDSGLFSQSAQVKVFGEVFQCPSARTEVVTVGIAQTTDVKSIGGVPISQDPDFTTWSQIVQDGHGSVEGYQGANGLADHVAC